MLRTGIWISLLISATTTCLAEDLTYNGLYPSLTCAPADGMMLACGSEYCVQLKARPVESICLSLKGHVAFEDAYSNSDPKPWKNAGVFEVQEMAKPELNRPLFVKGRYGGRSVMILINTTGPITFTSSAPISDQKNEQYFGSTVLNRIIVAGRCRVNPANWCENNSR